MKNVGDNPISYHLLLNIASVLAGKGQIKEQWDNVKKTSTVDARLDITLVFKE